MPLRQRGEDARPDQGVARGARQELADLGGPLPDRGASRRIGSTNWVKASTMTIAATWLGMSTPSPTPITAQSAIASTTRPTSGQVSSAPSAASIAGRGEDRRARGRSDASTDDHSVAGADDGHDDEFRGEHAAATGRGQEGRGERLVAEFRCRRERAEQHREDVADGAGDAVDDQVAARRPGSAARAGRMPRSGRRGRRTRRPECPR